MKKALNQHNKLVDIIESTKDDTYTCPVCKEILTRNFGAINQFYSHPMGKGDGCELKFNYMMKNNNGVYGESDLDILNREYYNKEFNNVKIELSDYMSEEGYYLTQEQKNIIFAKEDKIKIAALAGSSKSTTLYYYSKERPFKKILYIVYNKSMKDSADQLYSKLPHVTVKTQHGLAYGYVGKFYKNKLTLNYNAVDIIKDLKLDWNRDMELAVKINAMMKEYMLSDVTEFEELNLFKDMNGNSTNEREEIIRYSKKLWALMKDYNNNIKITHDFYLKLFHLSKKDLSYKFDIITGDEMQDGSMLILDIIKSSNVPGVVLVGDKFQMIYGWRKAINVMDYFEAKEYKLTTSFRVSQNIANIANLLIKDIYKVDINMKGFNNKQTIVHEIDKSKPYVCLCRTNAYILAEVIEVIKSNKNAKLYFEGGYSGYNFNTLKDGYWFSRGHKVKNPLFNKFEDWNSMIEYAERIEDIELLAINRLVEKYGSLIPQIVDGIKYNTVKEKSKANVLFSTCHKSKGMTFTIPVYISDDIFDIPLVFRKEYIDMGSDKDFKIQDYYEETNIVYVAITRPYFQICFSDKIKDYLIMRYNFFKNNKETLNI